MNQNKIKELYLIVDKRLSSWMFRYGYVFLRMSMGIVFIWFGLLKVYGQSPANDLVARTVYWVNPQVFIPILGWWEVLIGFFFLFYRTLRVAIFLLFFQIGGTFLPLVLLPDICYQQPPFVLTIEGQYIVKNILIISAAIVLGGTVRNNSSHV